MNRRTAMTSMAALSLASTAIPAWALQENLRVHTSSPGSTGFTFTTTMQTIVQRETPIRMSVTSGQTSTRSTLDAANGNVDLFISSPAINHYMKNGTQMFKDMPNASDLFRNVRQVVNFPLGPYHIITYADSGIETLEDCRGRRIFIGPPGGAATTVGLAIMESATGMKPGDYEQAKLDWSSGQQAFQDRQVDLAIIPTELPSAAIMQFALLGKIKLITIPDEAFTKSPLADMLKIPGRTITDIAPDIYGENQINDEPIKAVGSWVGIGSHTGVDADTVYAVTKAMFDNIADMHATAEWMNVFTAETALLQLNAPVHAGAYRWYKENGIPVPEEFIPPEAS
ncbi:TAXI family TRAP transporter solute-binding subunit [Sulfitobacter sp. DFL-23]|nr:TAXI family TRAP transporter solute-binding subunit [Sulfitobacter sp. DFL-23]